MTRKRGFSLLELLIAIGIGVILSAAVFGVIAATIRADEPGRVRMEMQLSATRALREMTEVLKKTGPADVDSDGIVDFPAYFVDGDMASPYDTTFGTHEAVSGDDDFGDTYEIAFRIPQDIDGDGFPTESGTGRVEWGSDTYAIVLTPRADGVNELRLLTFDSTMTLTTQRVFVSYVERLLFETQATDSTLGLNQIRITLWLRQKDISEKTLKIRSVSTVNFRSIE